MNSAGTTALAVSANEESILNINGSLEKEMLSEEFISEEESTSSAEETPKEELTPPSEETPGEELTPPSEETPGEEITPPSEETPERNLRHRQKRLREKNLRRRQKRPREKKSLHRQKRLRRENHSAIRRDSRGRNYFIPGGFQKKKSLRGADCTRRNHRNFGEISEGFDIDFYVIIDGNKVKASA